MIIKGLFLKKVTDNHDKIKLCETSINFWIVSSLKMLATANPQIPVHWCVLLQCQWMRWTAAHCSAPHSDFKKAREIWKKRAYFNQQGPIAWGALGRTVMFWDNDCLEQSNCVIHYDRFVSPRLASCLSSTFPHGILHLSIILAQLPWGSALISFLTILLLPAQSSVTPGWKHLILEAKLFWISAVLGQ